MGLAFWTGLLKQHSIVGQKRKNGESEIERGNQTEGNVIASVVETDTRKWISAQ